MTGDVEEAILGMYFSGISVRKIAGVTEALCRVKVGKDVVSRIASRLEEQQKQRWERPLKEKGYPCLYLKAKVLVAEYRRHSNHQQPHSALGYQTPASSGLWASQTGGCGPYKRVRIGNRTLSHRSWYRKRGEPT